MPELPEVETIRLYLEKRILNKKISKIDILEKKQFIGDINKVLNKKIAHLQRVGKYLAISLENNYHLNIHLKMTGQILYSENSKNSEFSNIIPRTNTNKMPCKYTRAIIYFSDQSCIFFNDLRKFGWIKVSEDLQKPQGVDILAKDFTLTFFNKKISKSHKPIKTFLLDQNIIAGIGNIYANEALFTARINPQTISSRLTSMQINNLYKAVVSTIKKGIKNKGSSGKDEMYILPDGSKGGNQYFFQVYQKEKQPCLKCKSLILRIKQNGRSSFFCPICQKH